MARFYDSTYDPQRDSGTSGIEVSDLNPEDQRDVDLRRLDPEERDIYKDVKRDFSYPKDQEPSQERISKFMKSVRAAGEYKQRRGISEPTVRGRTPISKADLRGVELPSQRSGNFGDPGAGSTEYAHKPKPNAGKAFNYLDTFS
tara:strand:+ start:6319 stop:6750 length:432 start_codon:yes stop_codon:yes gene_type:complete